MRLLRSRNTKWIWIQVSQPWGEEIVYVEFLFCPLPLLSSSQQLGEVVRSQLLRTFSLGEIKQWPSIPRMGSLVSLTSKSSICSVFSFKAGPPLGVRPSVACCWRNPSSVQPQERDQTSKSPGDVTSSALRSNTFFSLSFTCESIFPAPADISIYEPGTGTQTRGPRLHLPPLPRDSWALWASPRPILLLILCSLTSGPWNFPHFACVLRRKLLKNKQTNSNLRLC